jgi:hypothetical protein
MVILFVFRKLKLHVRCLLLVLDDVKSHKLFICTLRFEVITTTGAIEYEAVCSGTYVLMF